MRSLRFPLKEYTEHLNCVAVSEKPVNQRCNYCRRAETVYGLSNGGHAAQPCTLSRVTVMKDVLNGSHTLSLHRACQVDRGRRYKPITNDDRVV